MIWGVNSAATRSSLGVYFCSVLCVSGGWYQNQSKMLGGVSAAMAPWRVDVHPPTWVQEPRVSVVLQL